MLEMRRFFEPRYLGMLGKDRLAPFSGKEWAIRMEGCETIATYAGDMMDVVVYFFDSGEYSVRFESPYGTHETRKKLLPENAGAIAHEIAKLYADAIEVDAIR
jgi:hypothetical protein